jgi:hypothetical protein
MNEIYSDVELINLANIPPRILERKIMAKKIGENLAWIRKLQMSVHKFSKKHKKMLDTQMTILGIVSLIERYCRPFIFQDHFQQVILKYPRATPAEHKMIADQRTEKTLLKYHY